MKQVLPIRFSPDLFSTFFLIAEMLEANKKSLCVSRTRPLYH